MMTTSRFFTLLFFGILCSTLTYWGILIFSTENPIAPPSIGGHLGELDMSAAKRLFANVENALPVVMDSNIHVSGVLLSQNPVVLVSVNRAPTKPFFIGDLISPGRRLVGIQSEVVTIEESGRLLEINTPIKSNSSLLNEGALPKSKNEVNISHTS